MPEQSNHAASARPLTRRTVVKGLAWAAPVIAVAQAVPAYAASSCLPIASPTEWDWSSDGVNGQQATFEGDVIHMWKDSTRTNGSNDAWVTAISPPIEGLVLGCKYSLAVDIRTQGGFANIGEPDDGGCVTRNTNVVITSEDTAGSHPVASYSTQGVGGNPVVAFPTMQDLHPGGDDCHGASSQDSHFGAWQTKGPFQVTANAASLQLKLAFTMWDNGNSGNNDDYQIRLRFTDCSCD